MPINGYTPYYEGCKSLIISEENGRKHIGENPTGYQVTHYRVDGVIFVNETACDYILINEDESKKIAYLIELKGCRVDKAVEQLKATSDKLKTELKNYNLQFRIVTSSSPSNKSRTNGIKASSYKLMKIWEKNGQLKKSTRQIKESI